MVIEAYRWFFLRLADCVGLGWGIVALSFITSAAMMPLMKLVAGVVRRETDYQSVILPQIADIKSRYSSDVERHVHIQRLYRRYGYSPLCAVKKVLPLFVQIPFLLLTYFMLKDTAELRGVSFLFLRDLGQPDALLWAIGKFPLGLNVLPVVMTVVNMLTVASTPGFTRRDQMQAVGIALLFLVLLYSAPSALLLYWTLNNVITMIRTLVAKRGDGAKLLLSRVGFMKKYIRIVHWSFVGAVGFAVFAFGFSLLAFYLFLTARSLVVLSMDNMTTYMFCRDWMIPVLMMSTIMLYCALWRDEETAMRWGVIAFVCCFAASMGILLLVRFVSRDVFWIVKSHLGKLEIFEFLSVFFIVPCFLRRANAWNGVLGAVKAAFIDGWSIVLLLLSMGVHYAFSSTSITLSLVSTVLLCVYMVVPPVAMAILYIAAFRRWMIADLVFKVVMAFWLGIYIIPLVSTENGVFSFDANILIRLLLIALLIFSFCFWGQRKTFKMFCMIFSLTVCVRAMIVRCLYTTDAEIATGAVCTGQRDLFNGVKCVKQTNVYFLIYDAFENLIVQKGLGIDDPTLPHFLKDHGYKLYDAYSTGFHTLASMSAAFSVNGVMGGSMRSTIAGDNPQHDFLRANGYRTSYMMCGYTMPSGGERIPGDYYYPTPSGMVPKELVLYTCILRGILSQSPSVFNHYTPEEWTNIKRNLIKQMPSSGNFLYAHSGRPDHAAREQRYRAPDSIIIRDYKVRLALATKEMIEDVEAIEKKDDDAIVVLASDHGAYLLSPEIVDKPDARHLLDRHGVFLAIRWPKDYVPCIKLNCLQNVMLEVLIYLTGDISLARYKSLGETDPMESPVATSRGLVKNGIIQAGNDEGKDLFDAAKELFASHEKIRVGDE